MSRFFGSSAHGRLLEWYWLTHVLWCKFAPGGFRALSTPLFMWSVSERSDPRPSPPRACSVLLSSAQRPSPHGRCERTVRRRARGNTGDSPNRDRIGEEEEEDDAKPRRDLQRCFDYANLANALENMHTWNQAHICLQDTRAGRRCNITNKTLNEYPSLGSTFLVPGCRVSNANRYVSYPSRQTLLQHLIPITLGYYWHTDSRTV